MWRRPHPPPLTPRAGVLLALLLLLLLLVAALAGCAAPAPPPPTPGPDPTPPTQELGPDVPRAMLLALDGRWDVPREAAEGLLQRADVGPVAGVAWFGTGILRRGEESLPYDHAALDAGALAAVGADFAPPEEGTLVASRAYADAHGLAAGDEVTLQAWRWPVPLVATAFEMDRTRACDPEAPAKLCFAEQQAEGITELHLRVAGGAQDLSFLPDLAELGTSGVPAWWNGTFRSPSNETFPFQARVDRLGAPTPALREGPLDPGTWIIRYTLDTAKGRAPAGLAGIVRLREPGYQWFDDRIQAQDDPAAQAEGVLRRAVEGNVTLRVARVEAFPRNLSAFDLLLAPADARALRAADEERVGGLVVVAGRDAAARIEAAREGVLDPALLALQLRPFAPALPRAPTGDALVFRAPPDVDAAALPPVEGAGGPPAKALALEPPVLLPVSANGTELPVRVRLLAPAGPPPWTMPPGARWASAAEAMENLSRSRTLVLASGDLAPQGALVQRLVLGDEVMGRVAVLVGTVQGGPAGTLWASAALVAGAGEPAGARIVLPLAPGADADAVAQRARAAWGPLGLALEASSKP